MAPVRNVILHLSHKRGQVGVLAGQATLFQVNVMATRRQGSPTEPKYRIDSRPYADMVKQTRVAACRALSRYGEPAVSLSELREEVDAQLGAQLLSEWIIKERKAAL